MNKEQQDQLWKELSEESKKAILEEYNDGSFDDWNGIQALEVTFGTHNLNPKPQIKTWEDVIDNEKFEEIDSTYVELEDFLINKDMDNKLRNKILATYQIQQLINLSYGGMVSEEEWNDCNIPKYSLLPREWMGKDFDVVEVYCKQQMNFISFHTKQQSEEFMSYESNRRLVEQYFMM